MTFDTVVDRPRPHPNWLTSVRCVCVVIRELIKIFANKFLGNFAIIALVTVAGRIYQSHHAQAGRALDILEW